MCVLNLNASKSEVSFFSTWTGESTWEPEIQIDGKKIDCVATPRLLGVTLDRQLTFGTHVENVTKAAISSNRMLIRPRSQQLWMEKTMPGKETSAKPN